MSFVLSHAGDALRLAFEMFWAVLWPLALGFLLSAVVETFVSKQAISRLLGRGGVRPVALAIGCSARRRRRVPTRRSRLRGPCSARERRCPTRSSSSSRRRTSSSSSALALLVLLGWQFLAAEFAGGLVMVVLLAIIFRLTLTPRLAPERTRAGGTRRAREDGRARRHGHVGDRGPAARPCPCHRERSRS